MGYIQAGRKGPSRVVLNYRFNWFIGVAQQAGLWQLLYGPDLYVGAVNQSTQSLVRIGSIRNGSAGRLLAAAI